MAQPSLSTDPGRFDRSSWAAVAYASFILVVVIAAHIAVWNVPADGWAANHTSSSNSPLGDISMQGNL